MATVAKVQLEPQPSANLSARPRRSAQRIALRVIADAVAVTAALLIASIIYFEILPNAPASGVNYTLITFLAAPIWVSLFYLYGLYEPRQVLGPVNEFKQVFHGVVAGTVVLFMGAALLKIDIARGWVLLAMFSGLVVVGGERLVVRKVLHFLRRRGGDSTRTIVLGANHEGRTVARTLEREAWLGYKVIGFVDDDLPAGHELPDGYTVIGSTTELKDLIEQRNANLILVAASAFDAGRLNRLFWELQDAPVDLQITSGTIDLLASRMIVQSVAGVPLLYVRRTGMNRVQETTKRTLDIVASGLACC